MSLWQVYTPEVDFSDGDELWYSVFDGDAASAPTRFEFKFLRVDAMPRTREVVATVLEDSMQGTLIALNGSDSDSNFVTLAITELPRKGKLYHATGEPIQTAFSVLEVSPDRSLSPRSCCDAFDLQVMAPLPPMFASIVKNVSTFWPSGPNPKKPPCPFSMPANSSAEQLACGYPQWHPFQILGKPSTDSYGDSDESWCPSSRLGDNGFLAGGDGYIQFAWDPSLSFKKYGYTEFIEVSFPTPVYVLSIEIGEPRGMGSIVRIQAFNPSTGDYSTVWESPDGEGDPIVQYRHQLRTEYRVFRPFPICQTTFKTDTIRIELDTRTVTDWNELDYVQLIGSEALPHAVLPQGVNEIMYVPDSNAFGADAFSYTLTDCPFDSRRQSLPATVAISIAPVNDPPIAANLTITDLERQLGLNATMKVAKVDLATLTTDVDGDHLTYSVDHVRGGVDVRIEGSLLLLHFPEGRDLSFEVCYSVMDPSKTLALAFISYRDLSFAQTEDDFNTVWVLVGAFFAAVVTLGGVAFLLRKRHSHLEAIISMLFTEASSLVGKSLFELADLVTDGIACYRLVNGDFKVENEGYRIAYEIIFSFGAAGTVLSLAYRLRNACLVREHLRVVLQTAMSDDTAGRSKTRQQEQQQKWELAQIHRSKVESTLALMTAVVQGMPARVGPSSQTWLRMFSCFEASLSSLSQDPQQGRL